MPTYTVNSAQGLQTALSSAKSGDTIQLLSGDYKPIDISGVHFAGAGVTITSADPAHEAKLNGLTVRDAEGLNFKGLEFVVDPTKSNPFQVVDSKTINFDNLNVHGVLNDDPTVDSKGLFIRRSEGVTVTNSEFQKMQFGVSHADSDKVTISGNYFHDIGTDGVRGGGTSHITVSNNYFTNFHPPAGAHPDAIQFWTTNTTASATDITVTGNVVLRGDGASIQGVFFRDQVGGLPYKNVVIQDNLVVGGMYNGIQVNGGDGVTIKNNTVAGLPDKTSWISIEDATNVVMSGNKSTEFVVGDDVSKITQTAQVQIGVPTDGGKAVVTQYFTTHNVLTAMPKDFSVGMVADLSLGKIEAVRAAAKVMAGTEGADKLVADGVHDTRIEAGGGDDVLTGGGVASNTLIGGAGDDTYRVRSEFDTVVEGKGGGDDLVVSTVDYTLTDNVERLTLSGDTGLVGMGNALSNKIAGTVGNDTISGQDGDDLIQSSDGADKVSGGEGIDTLYGGEGNDSLSGNNGDDKLRGDGGNDTLAGGAGNDVLDGSGGADMMSGGVGADSFVFRDGEVAKTGEVIVDFTRAEGDVISLSAVDANVNVAGDQKFALIGTTAFSKVAGQLRFEVSGHDAYLMGDTNGDGLADFKILVQNVQSFQSSDFLL